MQLIEKVSRILIDFFMPRVLAAEVIQQLQPIPSQQQTIKTVLLKPAPPPSWLTAHLGLVAQIVIIASYIIGLLFFLLTMRYFIKKRDQRLARRGKYEK